MNRYKTVRLIRGAFGIFVFLVGFLHIDVYFGLFHVGIFICAFYLSFEKKSILIRPLFTRHPYVHNQTLILCCYNMSRKNSKV